MNALTPLNFHMQLVVNQAVIGRPERTFAPFLDRQVASLHRQVYWRGKLRRLWRRLKREPAWLESLQDVAAGRPRTSVALGIQLVPLALICGSEGRTGDFDRQFYPTQTHTRDRWTSIVKALLYGQSLPPVALVKIGERYFVRDGHHRISAALLLQQETIEADLIEWVLAPAKEHFTTAVQTNSSPLLGYLQVNNQS